jgi:hypothetical protein
VFALSATVLLAVGAPTAMSKLFDKLDHVWELAQIDQAEIEAAHGHEGPDGQRTGQLTGFQLARLEGVGRSDRYRLAKSKVGPAVGQFETLRRRSRMKLLKTGQLMADLRYAMSLFKACPKCVLVEGQHRACEAHRKIVRTAMLAVKYAGEDNMATRLAQGRVWGEEDPTERHSSLNEWEQWYLKDKREGVWPGTHAYTGSATNLDWLKREYGSLDYRGWLAMMLEEEEIPLREYECEKARLNAQDSV